MNSELDKRLKQIGLENVVFGVFIILIILAYFANEEEVNYFLQKNELSKKRYYYLMIIIFFVVVLISGYYFYQSYLNLVSSKIGEYSKSKEYARLDFIASGAALLAGLIYLYIAITDIEIDAEISL